MAMIKCPECGKEISDLASSCPNCGFPIGFESTSSQTPINRAPIYNTPNNSTSYNNIPHDNTPYIPQENAKNKEHICGIIGLVIASLAFFATNSLLAIIAIILCVVAIKKNDYKNVCGKIGLGIGIFALLFSILAPIYLEYVNKARETNQTVQIENQTEVQSNNSKEKMIPEEKETTNAQSEQNKNQMQTGTYIIGEDIDSGKYNFQATSGTGTLRIYKSYEDYKNDEYGYDAFWDFDMLADGASVGLLNQDVYTDFVFGIRLEDEYCIVVDKGLELEYSQSNPISDNILNVGIYIIGEDIKSGKFDFTAVKGSGNCKIYNTYDECINDKYGYDAFEDYDMKEENASVGMLNEDVYSQFINNVRLEDGQCLVIEKGLKIKYTEK